MHAGSGVFGIAWDTWRAGHGGADAIARRQQARLAGLVEFARSASPYYRKLYRDVAERVTDPRQLPWVGKRELMAHFDEWVTDPHLTLAGLESDVLADMSGLGSSYRGKYLVVTTSGTSGEPAVLVHDRASWTVAGIVVRVRERRTLITGRGCAGFPPPRAAGGGPHCRRRPFRRRRDDGNRAAAEPRHRPAGTGLLGAQAASGAGGGTQRLQANAALRLPECDAPAGRGAKSRAVTDPSRPCNQFRREPVRGGRAEIESELGCRVTERYLSSEVPALTSQCRKGSFHVNADWYIVEPVDADYHPVPAGVTSHTVLVTGLANRVQPLIRYDLGDRVELAVDPVLRKPLSRCARRRPYRGACFLFDARRGEVTVLPLALGTVIEETAGVRRFQAIRTGPGSLTVRLELWPGAALAEVRERWARGWAEFFAAQGAGPVAIEHADELPRPDRSGKFRQVWSCVSGRDGPRERGRRRYCCSRILRASRWASSSPGLTVDPAEEAGLADDPP